MEGVNWREGRNIGGNKKVNIMRCYMDNKRLWVNAGITPVNLLLKSLLHEHSKSKMSVIIEIGVIDPTIGAKLQLTEFLDIVDRYQHIWELHHLNHFYSNL